MEQPVIHGESLDEVSIEWEEEISTEDLMVLSTNWLANRIDMTTIMNGLNSVGEVALTLEPFEEEEIES